MLALYMFLWWCIVAQLTVVLHLSVMHVCVPPISTVDVQIKKLPPFGNWDKQFGAPHVNVHV